MNHSLGWLSPEGILVPCGSYGHISVAHDLVNKLNYERPLLERKSDEDILVDNGWVHIGISAMEHKYAIWWNYRTILSKEQKEYLNPYFEDRNAVTAGTWMHWEQDNDLR